MNGDQSQSMEGQTQPKGFPLPRVPDVYTDAVLLERLGALRHAQEMQQLRAESDLQSDLQSDLRAHLLATTSSNPANAFALLLNSPPGAGSSAQWNTNSTGSVMDAAAAIAAWRGGPVNGNIHTAINTSLDKMSQLLALQHTQNTQPAAQSLLTSGKSTSLASTRGGGGGGGLVQEMRTVLQLPQLRQSQANMAANMAPTSVLAAALEEERLQRITHDMGPPLPKSPLSRKRFDRFDSTGHGAMSLSKKRRIASASFPLPPTVLKESSRGPGALPKLVSFRRLWGKLEKCDMRTELFRRKLERGQVHLTGVTHSVLRQAEKKKAVTFGGGLFPQK
jgi:hypothetical protein